MSTRCEKIEISGSEAENDHSIGGIPIVYSELVPKGEVWIIQPDGSRIKFVRKDD